MKKLLLISLFFGIMFSTKAMAMDYDEVKQAIQADDVDRVRHLLDVGLQTEPDFKIGKLFAYVETAEMATMLIDDYHADVNEEFTTSCFIGNEELSAMLKPLHVVKNEYVAKLLLKRGADVHARLGSGSTPLHNFASYKDGIGHMRVFLEAGADVNAQDKTGDTPLIKSTLANDIQKAKLLVSYGANSTIENDFGNSPMRVAQRSGNSEMVALFERQQKIRFLLRENNVPNITTLLRNKEMYGSFRSPYED